MYRKNFYKVLFKYFFQRKEREQAERASLNHLTLNSAGVWSSASQSLSWANKAASAAAPVITLSNTQPGPQQAWNSSSNSLAWSAIAQSNVNNTSSGWNSETTMYNQNSSTQNLGKRSGTQSEYMVNFNSEKKLLINFIFRGLLGEP